MSLSYIARPIIYAIAWISPWVNTSRLGPLHHLISIRTKTEPRPQLVIEVPQTDWRLTINA